MTVANTVPRKQVGQILIENGLVSCDQLDEALAAQKKSGHNKLLGEVIIELGFCTEYQFVESLAEAYGMPYAKLDTSLMDHGVLDALPRDFIEKQTVLPLFKVNNVLTAAITEPANLFLMEEIT